MHPVHQLPKFTLGSAFKWMESRQCELRKAPHTSIIIFGCMLQKPSVSGSTQEGSFFPCNKPAGKSPEPGRHLDLDIQDPGSSCLEGGNCSPSSRLEQEKGKGQRGPHISGPLLTQKSCPNGFSYETLARAWSGGYLHSRGAWETEFSARFLSVGDKEGDGQSCLPGAAQSPAWVQPRPR